MTTHVLYKVNSRLRFPYRQNKSLEFLYVDHYVTQWNALFLIMHVTLGTQILTKI